MNPTNGPFHLHASRHGEDAPVDPGAKLPPEVAGQPASYFWKDFVHAGDYAHPTGGYRLAVDADRLSRWAQTGQAMLDAGLAIPINCDHSDRARDVVGYVKQFKLDGDRLLGLCQFIGTDAALMAARNLVSVGIDPDFVDGQGRNWGEAIVHLALTPVPVVPDQDDFLEVSPTDAQSPVSDQASEPAGETPDDLDPAGAIADQQAEIDENTDDSDESTSDLQMQLSAAHQRIVELSARLPEPIGDFAQAALLESAAAKLDLAVQRGALSPAARDGLVGALLLGGDGKPNLWALSRCAPSGPNAGKSLAMTIADILLDNQPLELGERCALQAMTRPVPGETSTDIDQLRQYMTRVASVG